MVRIQISLSAKEHALVQKRAKSLGISMAEFMRRAIRDHLPPESNSPWMRYAGLVQSGNSGSRTLVDQIVYCLKD